MHDVLPEIDQEIARTKERQQRGVEIQEPGAVLSFISGYLKGMETAKRLVIARREAVDA